MDLSDLLGLVGASLRLASIVKPNAGAPLNSLPVHCMSTGDGLTRLLVANLLRSILTQTDQRAQQAHFVENAAAPHAVPPGGVSGGTHRFACLGLRTAGARRRFQ